MKNFIQEGDRITVTAPAAVAAGAGVLVGSLFGVAQFTAASGDDLVIQIEGVFEMAKATGQAWTQGVKLYWDNTAKNVTTTLTSNTLIGCATQAQLAGDTTGNVYLDGAIR